MEMASPKFTVEPLDVQDLYWFVTVAAYNMLKDELKRPELFNRDHIFMLAAKAMENGTAFVAKVDGEPVGALGGILVPNLFNPEVVTLTEIFWYVLPEYRSTRAGALLLFAFDKLGDELGVERTLSLLPSSEINVQSLEKRGYLLEEFGFRKKHE